MRLMHVYPVQEIYEAEHLLKSDKDKVHAWFYLSVHRTEIFKNGSQKYSYILQQNLSNFPKTAAHCNVV